MKPLLINRIPQTPMLLAGTHTGIGVWYFKLAIVVGGRMRVWFWRVATGRSFCLPTMMGCHIRYQFVAYIFFRVSSFHCRSCPA